MNSVSGQWTGEKPPPANFPADDGTAVEALASLTIGGGEGDGTSTMSMMLQLWRLVMDMVEEDTVAPTAEQLVQILQPSEANHHTSFQRTRLNGFMQGIHESSSFSAIELWLPCDYDELRCVYASVARPQLLPWTQLSCACAFARGMGLPGRVYSNMSAILENRFDTLSAELDPRAPSAHMFGLVTAIGMPVATGSRAGVLLLYSTEMLAQLSALSVACTQRMLRIVLASQVHPRFANISTVDLGHIAGLHQQHEQIRELVESAKRRRETGLVGEQFPAKRVCAPPHGSEDGHIPGMTVENGKPEVAPPDRGPASSAEDVKPPPPPARPPLPPQLAARPEQSVDVAAAAVAAVHSRRQRSRAGHDIASILDEQRYSQGRRSAEEVAHIIGEVEKELEIIRTSIMPSTEAPSADMSGGEPSGSTPKALPMGTSTTSVASAIYLVRSRAAAAAAAAAAATGHPATAHPPPATSAPVAPMRSPAAALAAAAAAAAASSGTPAEAAAAAAAAAAAGPPHESMAAPPPMVEHRPPARSAESQDVYNPGMPMGLAGAGGSSAAPPGLRAAPPIQKAPAQPPLPTGGDVKLCKMDGCSNPCGKRMSYCSAHSCSRKCQYPMCTKCAQGAKKFCIAHGGGRRCKFPGCTKGARDKFFCAAHGGGKRCQFPGTCVHCVRAIV